VEVALGELAEVIRENADLLAQVGIELAAAENSEAICVSAFPSLIKPTHIEAVVAQLAETLSRGGSVGEFADIADEALHSIACRAAIKAGDKSLFDDLQKLAERILSDKSGKLQYCPHGRPIVVRISRRELEKKFKRLI